MRTLIAALAATAAIPAAAQVTLYGQEDFHGRSVTIQDRTFNLDRAGFGGRASSAIVQSGRYEVCTQPRFEGRCVVLRPGQYPALRAMGIDNSIMSVRPVGRQAQVEEQRFAPPPPVSYDYRPRRGERLFEADVVSVRAVYGTPERRCWVERQEASGDPGAAIAGALIGGILGHQVGNGRGNDAATVGGALAGAAIASNQFGTTYSRDVQHCRDRVSGAPQFYDVRYRFRGVERTVQMSRPPGATITVNRDGEPRAQG